MKRILVVALLMLLIGAGAYAETPEWSTIQRFPPSKAKGYEKVVSEDGFVTIYYDGDVHTAPPVERYAAIFEHVDQHFRNISRTCSTVAVYVHSWKKFERQMNKYWPEGAEQLRQGWSVYYAFTYESKNEQVIVIEAYQPPTDNTFIHELLHHYFNRLAKDGSLNQEELVRNYSFHVEAVFRTTLEEEF